MGLFGNKKNKNKTSNSGVKNYLKIAVSKDGAEYTFALDGKLDTETSPELDSKISEVIGDAKMLIFDLAELEYISSAGLRVLLSAQKTMNKQGDMVVKNASEEVNEIFEVTGFSDILTIE